MAILTIGIIGVARFLPLGLRASKSSEMMSKAAFLAQEKMEEFKLAGFTALSEPVPSIPLAGKEEGFNWVTEVHPVSLEGLSSSNDIRLLNLTVSWQEKGEVYSEEFTTYIGR